MVAAGKGVDYSLPKLGDQSRSALCGSTLKYNSSALPIACSSSSQRRTMSTFGASMQDNGGSTCMVSSFLACFIYPSCRMSAREFLYYRSTVVVECRG